MINLLPDRERLKRWARLTLMFQVASLLASALMFLPQSPFSGQIPQAHAADTVSFILAGTTSYTIPNDWSDVNKIEVIGGGGAGAFTGSSGGGGGGGGGYSSVTNFAYATPTVAYTVSVGTGATSNGAAGGTTYFGAS